MTTGLGSLEYADRYPYQLSSDPSYVHNPQEMKEKVNAPLEKRVRWIRDEGKFSVSSVDSAVIVKGVSDTFRQHQASLWQSRLTQEFITLDWATKISAVLGIVGVFAPSRIITIAFLGAIFIAGAIVARGTADQAEAWSRSPTQEIATLRTQAYNKELTKIPDGILHPQENP
jgi:hypothetical protein